MDTVSGDRLFVHCREVVPISEVTEYMLQSVGGNQFVQSTEVVPILDCPLSEAPLYTAEPYWRSRREEHSRLPFPRSSLWPSWTRETHPGGHSSPSHSTPPLPSPDCQHGGEPSAGSGRPGAWNEQNKWGMFNDTVFKYDREGRGRGVEEEGKRKGRGGEGEGRGRGGEGEGKWRGRGGEGERGHMCTNTRYYRNAMERQSNLDVQKDDILDKKLWHYWTWLEEVVACSAVFELVSIYTQAHAQKKYSSLWGLWLEIKEGKR